MANFQELFKFEYYFLSASIEVLKRVGITASFAQAGTADLTTPRVELQSLTAGPIGHVKNTSYSGSIYDAYNGTIQALVVTERALNRSLHSEFTSKVISQMSNLINYNTGSILPYHVITKIDFRSTNVSVDAEANMDFSALAMEYIIWIRPESWPT